MRLYEIYDDAECPVCGNVEGNHDHGPYENIPGYADAVGWDAIEVQDSRIHVMACARCSKDFDVVPEFYPLKALYL